MDNFKSTRMFIKMWQPQSNPHSNISYYCNELLTQFSLQTPSNSLMSDNPQLIPPLRLEDGKLFVGELGKTAYEKLK